MPTLGDMSACQPRAVARRRLLSAAAALTGVTTRDFVIALSLSGRASRPLSYVRVLRALVPTEAGGIRNTGPPMKEMIMDGCAEGNAN